MGWLFQSLSAMGISGTSGSKVGPQTFLFTSRRRFLIHILLAVKKPEAHFVKRGDGRWIQLQLPCAKEETSDEAAP